MTGTGEALMVSPAVFYRESRGSNELEEQEGAQGR